MSNTATALKQLAGSAGLIMMLAGIGGPAAAQQAGARTGDPVLLDPPPPGSIGAPAVGAVVSGSPTVTMAGSGAVRVGDTVACNTEVPLPGTVAAGSTTVFINGQAAARDNSPVTGCVDQWLEPGPGGILVPQQGAVGGVVRGSAATVIVGP